MSVPGDDLVALHLSRLHEPDAEIQPASHLVFRRVGESYVRLPAFGEPIKERLDHSTADAPPLVGSVDDKATEPGRSVGVVDRPHHMSDDGFIRLYGKRIPFSAVVRQAEVTRDGGDEIPLVRFGFYLGQNKPVRGIYLGEEYGRFVFRHALDCSALSMLAEPQVHVQGGSSLVVVV